MVSVVRSGWAPCVATVLTFQLALSCVHGQDDEDLAPGLIAEFVHGGTVVRRVDRQIAFRLRGEAPDPRLKAGPFRAVWTGLLRSQSTGQYRLSAYVRGQLKVRLGDRVLIDGNQHQAGWLHSDSLRLPYDWHPLRVEFKAVDAQAQLALFWSGPRFQLEPISARQYFHDPADAPQDPQLKGRTLAAAHRCNACHRFSNAADDKQVVPALAAPALDHLPGMIRPQWIVAMLRATSEKGATAERKMPYFGLSNEDARAIAAYLLRRGTAPAPLPPAKQTGGAKKRRRGGRRGKPRSPSRPSADRGRQLAHTVGCLACHRVEDLGSSGPFGGGDLTRVADKRPPEFFARWLRKPDTVNRSHRMPVFQLAADEVQHLAHYLAGLRSKGTSGVPAKARSETSSGVTSSDESPTAAQIRRGEQLVRQHRCGACHQLPTPSEAPLSRVPLTRTVAANSGCLQSPNKKRPGYRLSSSHQTHLVAYLEALRKRGSFPQGSSGHRLAEQNNCFACHHTDSAAGLAPQAAQVVEAYPGLAPQLPAMTPPSLVSVGDKLNDQALAAAIRRKGSPHRPWLLVRMPQFRLSDKEAAALSQFFIDRDRIPAGPHSPKPPPVQGDIPLAGARLVTPDGFGCTSCHQVGSVRPPKAPLNARGADLAQLGKRIRYAWFDRWVRNPSRIIPRMEMPSVQLPVSGVMNDNLDHQLATVWRVLNDPDFRPPAPNAVRIVRRSGRQAAREPAAVLTDVLQHGQQTYLKPVLVGLPNRHNFLFDLAQARTAGWWIGDAARQRTKGKTWFWTTDATDLLSGLKREEFMLEHAGKAMTPQLAGQFPTELDAWSHRQGSLRFDHRLHFAAAAQGPRTTVQVTQELTPLWQSSAGAGGFARQITARQLPANSRLHVRLLPQAAIAKGRFSADRKRFEVGEGERRLTLLSNSPIAPDGSVLVAGEPPQVRVEYRSSAAVDRFPELPQPKLELAARTLKVTPGFQAVRLPLVHSIMPTALAWRRDGRLAVASLKGRVWLLEDSNKDGLEDRLTPYSDELAAPFGLAAGRDYLDVVTKYGLLRLHDRDRDGRAERTDTLVSGWGHTVDYHDWVIGLPPDGAGGYFVALACQQDKRSRAAARHRGEVLRLIPREPSASNPHRFTLKTVSAGHRFPIGIARNRSGQLFVTDNQGNFNPFNELNHVRAGKRYGFINAIDRRPGFKPPLTPPAINIPHPWTRSVNGICFLETPKPVAARSGPGFGPFEGHLIGCEYDTRMLIRMSLEKVNGQYQGAAYPFSLYHPQDGLTFLGPLVCGVSPQGDLYVGCIRDSGWGGANNIGTLVRIRPQLETLPAGIAEVTALPHGFRIRFTRAVDAARASNPKNYALSSYTRISTPAYGGPDRNRRNERVVNLRLARNRRSVDVVLAEMRAGYVYEIRLRNLAERPAEHPAKHRAQFFPAEAYYSLQSVPRAAATSQR